MPIYSVNALSEDLESKILNALLLCKKEIDVSSLNIKNEDVDIFTETLKSSPYLYPIFITNHSYQYQLDDNQYVKTIYIDVSYDKNEIKKIKEQLDEKIEEIKSLVDDNMSDYNIALVLHDYLIVNSEYEYVSSSSATSGGLLLEGKGICDGYAHAYQYLLSLFNIESSIVSSQSMNHAWNLVKIGDDYYHVDCTWDDPISDRFGLAGHTYFMLSDKGIKSDGKHYGFSSDIKCTNTQYDNYLKDIISPICVYNNDLYYINDKGIVKNNELIKTLPRWSGFNDINTYWPDKYSGLFIYNGEIYYNTYDSIMKLSLDTNQESTVLKPDISKGYIYGIRLYNNKIEYILKQTPNDTGEKYTSDIELKPIINNIQLNTIYVELSKNDTYDLQVLSSSNQIIKDVSYSVEDEDIVSVDKGKITALNKGTTTVYVKYSDEILECKVKVKGFSIIDFIKKLLNWK
jgi:hypothetical protein